MELQQGDNDWEPQLQEEILLEHFQHISWPQRHDLPREYLCGSLTAAKLIDKLSQKSCSIFSARSNILKNHGFNRKILRNENKTKRFPFMSGRKGNTWHWHLGLAYGERFPIGNPNLPFHKILTNNHLSYRMFDLKRIISVLWINQMLIEVNLVIYMDQRSTWRRVFISIK